MILFVIGGFYLLMIAALLIALGLFTAPRFIADALADPAIRYSIRLSLASSTITAVLSLWVATPIAYLLARRRVVGRALIEALLDVPIVLPPLVIGLALLIVFQTRPGQWIESVVPVTFAVPAVVLAQFVVACAFAVRTLRIAFDQIDPRTEQVALTLGCTQAQAFWRVVLPEARRGLFAAGVLAWATAIGEFGPVLVFAGATRMKTEVMPTSIWLELNAGRIEAAAAVSMVMVLSAVAVTVLARWFGLRRPAF